MGKASATLDSIDRHLIELLRRDSRQPAGALARAVGLSRSTIQDRLGRLRRQGVIRRFTIDTTAPVEAAGARAFFLVRIEGRPCGRLIPGLAGMPEVESCAHVAGPMDVILTVRAGDLAGLSALRERIVAMPGIASVTVAPVLKTHLEMPHGADMAARENQVAVNPVG
ncbi:MAG: Lrp/AsnC family transcriptional regulator [Rhizobiales bacterium]|nr:Lrp/AsnC family transcriptional regulator [Hyphomicrobiales bacterium]